MQVTDDTICRFLPRARRCPNAETADHNLTWPDTTLGTASRGKITLGLGHTASARGILNMIPDQSGPSQELHQCLKTEAAGLGAPSRFQMWLRAITKNMVNPHEPSLLGILNF
jgi:hypothetical protein